MESATPGYDFSRAKVAIVTGGGSGIGRALCHGLALRGVQKVVVADLNLSGAEETAQQVLAVGNGVTARAVHCNVGDGAEIEKLIKDAEKNEGLVDIFIANAGIGGDYGGLKSANDALWNKQMAVNVYQSVWAANVLLPSLAKRGGCFATTSSAAGLMSQLMSPAYTTTKHAVRAFTEWLAITYGGAGLHVACLCPQAVRTAMTGNTDGGVAGGDGVVTADEASESLLKALEAGRFLALPHPKVAEYVKRKAMDVDRWLAGMKRWQGKMMESFRKSKL